MSIVIFNFLLNISTALNCFDNGNYYTWILLPRQHFFDFYSFFSFALPYYDNKRYLAFSKRVQ